MRLTLPPLTTCNSRVAAALRNGPPGTAAERRVFRFKHRPQAKRVTFDGPRRTVIDGPFAETRELVAGFWLFDVKDMGEAVAWVKRCPNPMPGPSEIEIRPLYEMADLR